jgi:hypothetical protein
VVWGVFYRKQKAALARFHPLHQALVHEHRLSVTLPRDAWEPLIQSCAQHRAHIRRRKWALPDEVPLVLVPLVRVLSRDIRRTGTIGVTADLTGPEAAGKAGPQQSLQVRRPIRRLLQWYAFDPWLAVRAELRDGSTLDIAVMDRVRFRRITKSNPRGKIKTKTKSKTLRVITVTRRLPKGTVLTRPASPPPPWIRVRIKDGPRPVIRLRARIPNAPRSSGLPNHILHLSAEAFRWTAPQARRAS